MPPRIRLTVRGRPVRNAVSAPSVAGIDAPCVPSVYGDRPCRRDAEGGQRGQARYAPIVTRAGRAVQLPAGPGVRSRSAA